MEIRGGKYLTFLLGKEIYGIPVDKVKEIIGMTMVTLIPIEGVNINRGYIRGIINLRKTAVPILDLWFKLGLEALEDLAHTCIIVIEASVSEEQMLLGIIVDSVSEVVNIARNDIEPLPEYGELTEGDFLAGLGKLKTKLILIPDWEKILNQQEQIYIKQELKSIKIG